MFLIEQIAAYLDAKVVGDTDLEITKLAPLDSAEFTDITFCAQNKFLEQLKKSNASAVLVTKEHSHLVKNTAVIVEDPYLAFAQISKWFDWRAPVIKGRAITSCIAQSAKIADSVQICAGVVIGENTHIAGNCYIGANSVIADNCVIGANSRIEANVSFYNNVAIGERCIVHSGAVLGADGFGFARAKHGWQKIHQLGGVVVGNDVEIGSGTTIDRGAIADTIIGDGVKLDNQVQIAHSVHLGDNTAIAGCSAIAGSTRIGENCTIAGLSGITGHLTVAAGTHITAMSLVSHSIKEAGVYSSGTGIEKHHSWKRNVVRFRALDTLVKRVKNLESEIKKLSSKE